MDYRKQGKWRSKAQQQRIYVLKFYWIHFVYFFYPRGASKVFLLNNIREGRTKTREAQAA